MAERKRPGMPGRGSKPRPRPNQPTRRQLQERRRAQIQKTTARRRKRRKRNYTLYYILLGFFLTVAGITLSLTVFFNIQTITVAGSDRYHQEDVLPVLNAKIGDNLLRLNTDKLETEVLAGLPTAEQVRVKRVLPSTLRIEVTDGVPVIQLYQDGVYRQLGKTGRVLGVTASPQPELVTVLGFASQSEEVGSYFSREENSEVSDWLEILLPALQQAGIGDISIIDLSDFINVRLYYQNRFEIQLGSFSELETKLQMVRAVLDSGKIGLEERGTIDASATDQLIVDQAEISLPCEAAFTWQEPAPASQPAGEPAASEPAESESTQSEPAGEN